MNAATCRDMKQRHACSRQLQASVYVSVHMQMKEAVGKQERSDKDGLGSTKDSYRLLADYYV